MVNFGFNANALPLGYGMQAGYGYGSPFTGARVNGGGSGFSIPAYASTSAAAGERFVSSQSGGVILDSSGAPAGRVPAGAFVDVTTGTVYDSEGKQVAIPEGGGVDFFDLPDIAVLTQAYQQASGGGAATGKGGDESSAAGANAKGWDPSLVAGQWGPGGVTDLKGGGTATQQMAGCEHDHSSAVGGAKGGGVPAGKDTAVAGASGGGDTAAGIDAANPLASVLGALTPAIQQLQSLLQSQIANIAGGGKGTFGLPSTSVAGASGGGGATQAASGAGGLGTTPSLDQSLAELVSVLKQLVTEMQQSPILGGGGAPDAPGKGGGPGQVGQWRPHPHHHPHQHPVQVTTPATTTTTDDSSSGTEASTEATTDSSASTDTSTSTDDTSTSTSTDDGSTSTDDTTADA
jgi:hypothetical protein